MPFCNKLSNEEMDFDSIFDIACPACGTEVEFFEDDRNKQCPNCRGKIINPRYKNGACIECRTNKNPNYISRLCDRFRQSKRQLSSSFIKLYR